MEREPLRKCIVCGDKAEYSFSPDIDIEGIPSCKRHMEVVQTACDMLLLGNRKMFDILIKNAKANK
jgi:hypothetical protein